MDDTIEYYTTALVLPDTLHKINAIGHTFYLYCSETLPRTTCFSAIIGHSDFGMSPARPRTLQKDRAYTPAQCALSLWCASDSCSWEHERLKYSRLFHIPPRSKWCENWNVKRHYETISDQCGPVLKAIRPAGLWLYPVTSWKNKSPSPSRWNSNCIWRLKARSATSALLLCPWARSPFATSHSTQLPPLVHYSSFVFPSILPSCSLTKVPHSYMDNEA